MTLLITLFAAIVCTIIWYVKGQESQMKIGALCWMYWGASFMWFIDAIFEYAELKAEFFAPALEDMINDSYLGLSVIAFGMMIWLAILLITDPKGTVKNVLFGRQYR